MIFQTILFDVREDVENIQRGGVYKFWGGCRPFSPILGGVHMGRFPERQHFFAENDKIGILQSR